MVGLLLLMAGISAAGIVLGPPGTQAPPPRERVAAASFGDDLQGDFQQGFRNGTDTHGVNDHVVPRDDFDGAYIDPNTWSQFAGTRGAFSHQNGSAHHEIFAPGTTENDSITTLNGAFVGDFDLRINVSLTFWDSSFGMVAFFAVCGGNCSAGPPFAVGRGNFSGTETWLGIDGSNPGSAVPTANTSGALRLKRTGSLLEGLYWNATGGTWDLLVSNASGPAGPLPLLFGIHQESTTPFLSGPVSAEFDLFLGAGTVEDAPFSREGGPPVQDAVRLLPLNDNFDDDILNPDRWDDPVINNFGSWSETGGDLELQAASGGGGNSVHLPVRAVLRGDFDVRVGLRSANAFADYTRGGIQADIGAATHWVGYETDSSTECFSSSGGGCATAANGMDLVRMVRQGATIYHYYRFGDDTPWNLMATEPAGPEDALLSLFSISAGFDEPGSDFIFDGFQVVGDRNSDPITYADALFESRVIDTGETVPANPKWDGVYFNTTTDYFVDNSTAALWYFEDGLNPFVRDESPNRNEGQTNNNLGIQRIAGPRGDALDFESSDSMYINVTSDPTLRPPADLTIEAWFRLESLGLAPAIVKYVDSGDRGYALEMNAAGDAPCFHVRQVASGWASLCSPAALSLGTWHHVAGTFSATTGEHRIYVDGTEVASAGASSNPIDYGIADLDLAIGRDFNLGRYFDGAIDEVRILWRTLAPDGAMRDYQVRSYVRFQLASSDSPSGPWSFAGPDGTPATWYSLSGMPAILTDGDRYFRYRAEFNSTNSTATPILWDLMVTADGPTIPELGPLPLIAATSGLVLIPRLARRRGSRVCRTARRGRR